MSAIANSRIRYNLNQVSQSIVTLLNIPSLILKEALKNQLVICLRFHPILGTGAKK